MLLAETIPADAGLLRFTPGRELAPGFRTLLQDIDLFLENYALTYSQHTVSNYGYDLVDFEQLVSDRYGRTIPSDAVSEQAIQFYLLDLRKRHVSSATFERKFHSLKSFFEFRLGMCVLPNPMVRIRSPKARPRPLPRFLSVQEAAGLCNLALDGPAARRDKAIFETLYSTGIRVSELAGLDWPDLDADGGFIMVRRGKGAKDRIVPIGKPAVRKLLELRGDSKAAGPIFRSRRGDRRLTARAIELIFAAGAKQAGLEGVSPHTMRHCFATHMLQNGADLHSIREMAGHSNLSTTAAYAHVDVNFLRDQIARHPAWRKS